MVEWKGFAKVWLWLCLIVNVIVSILTVIGLVAVFRLGNSGSSTIEVGNIAIVILSVVAEIGMLVGVVTLLFAKKKAGFYIIVVVSILSLISNALSKTIIGIIGAIIAPTILFLAIRGYWDDLD